MGTLVRSGAGLGEAGAVCQRDRVCRIFLTGMLGKYCRNICILVLMRYNKYNIIDLFRHAHKKWRVKE